MVYDTKSKTKRKQVSKSETGEPGTDAYGFHGGDVQVFVGDCAWNLEGKLVEGAPVVFCELVELGNVVAEIGGWRELEGHWVKSRPMGEALERDVFVVHPVEELDRLCACRDAERERQHEPGQCPHNVLYLVEVVVNLREVAEVSHPVTLAANQGGVGPRGLDSRSGSFSVLSPERAAFITALCLR